MLVAFIVFANISMVLDVVLIILNIINKDKVKTILSFVFAIICIASLCFYSIFKNKLDSYDNNSYDDTYVVQDIVLALN